MTGRPMSGSVRLRCFDAERPQPFAKARRQDHSFLKLKAHNAGDALSREHHELRRIGGLESETLVQNAGSYR